MLTDSQVMEELKALGSEQTRKTYGRHGVSGEAFGVKYGDLGKLTKKIKTDHALAKQLWATGNHDARILATMVADPQQADDALIDAWTGDLPNYVVADALASYVAKTPLARAKMEAWTRSADEWIGTAGWGLLSHLALNDLSLPDAYFEPYLETIERDIHASKNRVRYAMNNAVIAIGLRSPQLEEKAIAAAERIGKVEVDHGQTGCKTPEAVSYIQKSKARLRRA